MIELYHEDCMNLMARYPDKYYDLAVCDPPYGIGKTWNKNRYPKKNNTLNKTSYCNDKIPSKQYFDELKRVSNDQIIFGYNYFTDILGATNYLIVWDKHVFKDLQFYSMAEIAYTSIHKPIQVFNIPWDSSHMGKETGTQKIHPHQKPVELYIQILRKYAKPGWKTLDTHMGSGSSVIACHHLGLNVTACEIDEHYFKTAKSRIDIEVKQQELFTVKELRLESLFDSIDEAV